MDKENSQCPANLRLLKVLRRKTIIKNIIKYFTNQQQNQICKP